MAEKQNRGTEQTAAAKEPKGAVARWDPFAEFDPFEGWRGFAADFPRRASLLSRLLGEEPRLWAPAVDVSETDTNYVVTAELPGSKKEDVHVELEAGVLTIRGEKRNEREEKSEQRRVVERRYGSFARSFTLPSDSDGDRVRARFESGVLTVEIPKTGDSKPRVISVQS